MNDQARPVPTPRRWSASPLLRQELQVVLLPLAFRRPDGLVSVGGIGVSFDRAPASASSPSCGPAH
eukprot:scaffold12479_cov126-Isochrysis_galbana.AAC.1